MPSIMAIVSKAVFEKDARVNGKVAALGDTWQFDKYVSTNKALDPVRAGGSLVLVTVRPPDEQLWLVGVMESPAHDGAAWTTKSPNAVPVTNISHLRSKILFESGKGMSQDKGALGMSLQTPRALAAADMALLSGSVPGMSKGATAAPADASAPPVAPAAPSAAVPASKVATTATLLAAHAANPADENLREQAFRAMCKDGEAEQASALLKGVSHLNVHEPGTLPCLCKTCWTSSGTEVTHGDIELCREFVFGQGRVLFFWAPKELTSEATVKALRKSVKSSLLRRLEMLKIRKRRTVRPAF